jgi:catechol 2,3-dioxygenase-like lactoylglutathione lyase family enzyme
VLRIQAFDHLVLVVSDVERSVAWYVDRLGLSAERLDEWRAGKVPFPSVRVNESTIIDVLAGDRGPGENVDHLCLAVDAGVDWSAVVASGSFDVIEGPVSRWGARGVATSIYVRDPDGNTVELRSY